MIRKSLIVACILLFAGVVISFSQHPQTQNFKPVTDEMLKNPSPDDWLMFSRTYDAQRFSPLKQITKQNVGQLRLAFVREMGNTGSQESVPLVYRGVIYTFHPGAVIQAISIPKQVSNAQAEIGTMRSRARSALFAFRPSHRTSGTKVRP